MTANQQKFADEYIRCGNATQAYLSVYPKARTRRSAESASNRLLSNVEVKEYIDLKLQEISSQKIADAQEVMEYLTSVMRREYTETVVVTCKSHKTFYDENGKKQTIDAEEPRLVEIPAKLSDANKAAELLGKRYTMFTDKLQLEDNSIKIEIKGEFDEC